ncbi:hypothetical protein CI238_01240, partial [Colletotrichum incanum]
LVSTTVDCPAFADHSYVAVQTLEIRRPRVHCAARSTFEPASEGRDHPTRMACMLTGPMQHGRQVPEMRPRFEGFLVRRARASLSGWLLLLTDRRQRPHDAEIRWASQSHLSNDDGKPASPNRIVTDSAFPLDLALRFAH